MSPRVCSGCGTSPEIDAGRLVWEHADDCPVVAETDRRAREARGGFDMQESAQGVTREGYEEGRDSTHLAIPLAIDGAPDAAEAIARAERASRVLSNVVDQLPGVRWVTSRREGAYALLANLGTALGQLEDADRAVVLAAAPGLAELRQLLRLWVVELNDGRVAVATGPGLVNIGGELYRPRIASDEDLVRLG